MNSKLALVFGGSRGIGSACVDALARDGFDIAFTYVSNSGQAGEVARAVAQAYGKRVRCYAVDICDVDAVKGLFASMATEFGRSPDCVVVNAGINVPPGPIGSFDPGAFRKLVEVNIVGAFNILRESACRVANDGAIIALTTSSVRNVVAGVGPYAATKAAVESLIRSMAKELAPRNIRVNAVAPGPVDTDLFNSGKTEEAKRRSAAMSPFNRIGQPSEVAEVVSFLASPRASWIHGQIIQPNGGSI
ncbi:3-oxoacyl-(acyl-carrier protein) reductase [Paraburkholderia ribeironis]|uniref:3-oxoacyl-(Acyl-carrier protein) reductase n=2 Tax=Paraburkholderia ribeironis TaxID=1247936 RepID=A0A1N7S1U0_9BURK|nr:3-oxoacyl-(acyl-carrier protein) reductase [Paraburkholderia ribeironis]